MKKLFLILVILFFCGFFDKSEGLTIHKPSKNFTSTEKRLRIAVLDTGISPFQLDKSYMCRDVPHIGTNGVTRFDKNGHGTNVVGLIGRSIDISKYCVTSFSVSGQIGDINPYLEALELISKYNPIAINISWASEGYDNKEFELIKKYTDSGIKVIVAAGNKGLNLGNGSCNIYPACHALNIKNNLIVVGSTNKKYSNHGYIVDEYYPGDKQGLPKKTGTSQSTANYTGKLFSK